jgi:hypothetical protein
MRNFLILIVMLGAFMFASQANAQHPNHGWNNGFNNPYYEYYYRPPVVGYRPVITWLPSGTSLSIGNPQVYTYGGRRYVRFGVNAGFYNVQRVDTFNFVTGEYRRGR